MNEGALEDFATNAFGGMVGIKTTPFKGFTAGLSGSFAFKTFYTDLNVPDTLTGMASKYEQELYNIGDRRNYKDLYRLETFYLQYQHATGNISLGKLEITDTPLLNRSDGRMNPFAFQGLWISQRLGDQRFNLAWIDHIAPRSTYKWYSFNDGIGLTNNGFQPDGTEADYRYTAQTKGIGILDYHSVYKRLAWRFNYWYLHNLLHIGMIDISYSGKHWTTGLQYSLQTADRYQEQVDYHSRYIQPDEHGQVLSYVIAYQPEHWKFSFAYTHAFDSGRYLFPRELGRDQFFTSISRSRLEGFGNMDVITLTGTHDLYVKGLDLTIQYTRLFGPETNNYTFNKYNLDAYYQINTRIHYEVEGILKGLKFDLLYVYKENIHDRNAAVIFNKSNFHQINLITNFVF
ncbi:hypothetical protein [Robertkochia solimangrovi]|uniref:hypothetical protein n=1 Tax=Robertkochia solimangrovi TaxID=2213046 RepID=UPI001180ABF4|nr:hypothetical protein [Robertkochia solimangrovi]